MTLEPLVILDFETTGLQPERGDRITEVGLVRIELAPEDLPPMPTSRW